MDGNGREDCHSYPPEGGSGVSGRRLMVKKSPTGSWLMGKDFAITISDGDSSCSYALMMVCSM